MDGWTIKDGSVEAWVEDGLLVSQQTDFLNFSYLVYEKEFTDFIPECEVKLTDNLNSEILIRGVSDYAILHGRSPWFPDGDRPDRTQMDRRDPENRLYKQACCYYQIYKA